MGDVRLSAQLLNNVPCLNNLREKVDTAQIVLCFPTAQTGEIHFKYRRKQLTYFSFVLLWNPVINDLGLYIT